GTAAGLALGLAVIPSLYWGPQQAFALQVQMIEAVVHPALSDTGGDRARAEELTNITGTDNQSIQAILHNWQHWSDLDHRPSSPETWVRLCHWAVGGVLTLFVLAAYCWNCSSEK